MLRLLACASLTVAVVVGNLDESSSFQRVTADEPRVKAPRTRGLKTRSMVTRTEENIIHQSPHGSVLRRKNVLVDWLVYDNSTEEVEEQKQFKDGYAFDMVVDGNHIELEVVSAKGALIQAYRLNGKSIVLNFPWPDQMDGAVFWPSPQGAWRAEGAWPPAPEIDPVPSKDFNRSWDVHVKSLGEVGVVALTSGEDKREDLQLQKRLSMDETRGAIHVEYSITNVAKKAQSWAAWEITRVAPGGLSFFMTGENPPTSGSWAAMPVEEAGGATWFQQDKAEAGKESKLFSDTRKGWLAHTDGENVLVKCFEKLDEGQAAPGENQIEIYNSGGTYVELEVQGPYTKMGPGESLNYSVFWYIRPLPEGAKAEVGDPILLDFVNGLCEA